MSDNNRVGNFAIHKETKQSISLNDGVRGDQYICPLCEEDVIFKKGKIVRPYFCHKRHTNCSNYTNESETHLEAKQLLQNLLENRLSNIEIVRNCKNCPNQVLWDFGILFETSRIEQEFQFGYKETKRTADIACISETNDIECIFEVCKTHKTSEEVRPEPWFEFDAYTICEELKNISDIKENIKLHCIRESFCKNNEIYGLCHDCEMDFLDRNKGIIHFNQRGAGCGKTFESIQLLNEEDFKHKKTYIYLTKMRSAKDVIYAELSSQIKKGFLNNFTVVQKENKGNQYLVILQKPDQTLIKIIIGTIDSFTYAIRDKNKIFNGGSDYFQKIVRDIRDGNMTIGNDGSIPYASTTSKLTKECLIIIDEGQDLEKEYIDAFEKIIDRTGIDTYIIGDKLQSILSEKNLFTHLENAIDTKRIIKSTGRNIIKRFHNRQFIDLVNDTVHFNKWKLPEVEGICSNECCEYGHEDSIKPYIVDTEFNNIFTIDPEEINSCIDRILYDMFVKVQNHGYLPHNFMFIFPIINEKNKLLTMLYPAIQQFWFDFFMNPESYTDKIMENMRKNNIETENDYWKLKIENKENDAKYYQHILWHRSETNQPIDLSESVNSSRILSIHASKGNGCECVYFLGVSQFTLSCHTGGIANTLVYESLFHVGMTRQKKYLYVGIDGNANDDICNRFDKIAEKRCEQEPYIKKQEPYIKNITNRIHMNTLIDKLTTNELFVENISKNIIDYSCYLNLIPENIQKEKIVDWGHHIIRLCTMKINTDKYLYNKGNSQQIAKISTLINPMETKIIYTDYQIYKTKIKDLQNNIKKNIENRNKDPSIKKIPIEIPILIFYDDRTKTDYVKYRKIIEKFIERVLHKLKYKMMQLLCPIECLLYCHLMEMIHHPYSVVVSIMEIYRIISCYDDCYIVSMNEHDEIYKCKCKECFGDKKRGFIKPHDDIQKSIITHYRALERMNEIINKYNNIINSYTNGEQIEYRIDKKEVYGRDEFKLNNRFDYIGVSQNHIVFIILSPHFNNMNFYDIITRLIINYFILQKTEDKDMINKTIYASIFTLDTDEPIIFDLTDIFSKKIINIKEILKEFLLETYSKEHTKIYDFFNYHKQKNVTDKTNLLYVWDLIKERKYQLPDYIRDCLKQMDNNTKKNKKERKCFINDTEKFILQKLDEGLKDTIDTYLGINNQYDTDSDTDSDIDTDGK